MIAFIQAEPFRAWNVPEVKNGIAEDDIKNNTKNIKKEVFNLLLKHNHTLY